MNKFRSRVQWLVVFSFAVLAGCGPDSSRQAMSGTVTYKGKPLDVGTVTFYRTEGAPGPVCGSSVVNGAFEIPAAKGLDAGTYRVEISAPVPGGEMTAEQKAAGASQPAKESLPAKYNTASQLTAEVKPGVKNVFDFTLE